MKTKAQILAEWVIGITIAYPVLILLIYFLRDFIAEPILVFSVYLIIPILIINWILSIWSLKLERKMIEFWALLSTIACTFILCVIFYLLTTVKMC